MNGEKWVKHKLGKHTDITLTRDTQEKQSARFVRLGNGDWQKKEGN